MRALCPARLKSFSLPMLNDLMSNYLLFVYDYTYQRLFNKIC